MKGRPVKDNFLDKIIQIPFCECWLWIGCTTDRGYGSFRLNGKMVRAHRVSYLFFNGVIPEGIEVCHACDTPLCVNPKHLFLGTHKENMDDMMNKKRHKSAKGERNQGAKLNEQQVLEIRNSTLFTKELSELYSLNRSTIQRIRSGKTWNCLE